MESAFYMQMANALLPPLGECRGMGPVWPAGRCQEHGVQRRMSSSPLAFPSDLQQPCWTHWIFSTAKWRPALPRPRCGAVALEPSGSHRGIPAVAAESTA